MAVLTVLTTVCIPKSVPQNHQILGKVLQELESATISSKAKQIVKCDKCLRFVKSDSFRDSF